MSNAAIEFRISPSLHPACAAKFSDIQPVTSAYESGYSSLKKVYEEKDKISEDKSLSLEGKKIAIQRIADRHQTVTQEKFASTKDYLNKSSDALRLRLTKTIVEDERLAGEIRSFVKSNDDRDLFLSHAINKGHVKTVSAVLAAPSYLSGLTDEKHTYLLNDYYKKMQPELSEKLSMMEAALQAVTLTQEIIAKEFQKAGGTEAGDAIANARSFAAERAAGSAAKIAAGR